MSGLHQRPDISGHIRIDSVTTSTKKIRSNHLVTVGEDTHNNNKKEMNNNSRKKPNKIIRIKYD